jgi:hypothetical protein
LAIFTTNVDAENQTLINQKCVCGALNRQFLVGAVMGWASFGQVLLDGHKLVVLNNLFPVSVPPLPTYLFSETRKA